MKSEDLLWAVVNMYKYERKTMRQIANSLCISLGTVHETLHRFRRTGDVAHKVYSSKKPTILTDLEMNCVRELIVANPAGYLDEYCEIIRRHLGKTISPSTMYRVIKVCWALTRDRDWDCRGRSYASLRCNDAQRRRSCFALP